MEPVTISPAECPRCGKVMRASNVKTAIWYEDKLIIAEDVPAQVCDECLEQYYDEDTTDALRRLTEDGFPLAQAKGEILVPVFSLKPLQALISKTQEIASDSD